MARQEAWTNWNTHINKWMIFLHHRIEQLEQAEDPQSYRGDIVKLKRQLQTLYNVRFGVVASPRLFERIVYPESIDRGGASKRRPKKLEYYNKSLNEHQKAAVSKALQADRLCLIQGPPGTGKTTVITEICLHLLMSDPSSRILVCSETHVAVNNVLERLYEQLDNFSPLRVGNRDPNVSEDVDESSTEAIVEQYLETVRPRIDESVVDGLASILRRNVLDTAKDLIRSHRVVGITCNGIARYGSAADLSFDCVIIDEVSKATLPEVLIPLSLARKAILVGDPAQLPPLFCYEDRDVMDETSTREVEDYKYIDELFRRTPEVASAMLTQQFRMTNEIGNLVSHFFYDDLLKNGLDRSVPDSVQWVDYDPTSTWPMEPDDPIYNLDEVDIILDILDTEHATSSAHRSVAIIAPYRPQMRKIRQRLSSKVYPNFEISVDTVDAFQGKDADYVIFSVTRTTGSMRFFADPRRLNVALSRAKHKLWIVGATVYTDGHDLLRRLAGTMKVTAK